MRLEDFLYTLCANMSETGSPSAIIVERGKKSHFDKHEQDKLFFRCVGTEDARLGSWTTRSQNRDLGHPAFLRESDIGHPPGPFGSPRRIHLMPCAEIDLLFTGGAAENGRHIGAVFQADGSAHAYGAA